MSRTKTVEQGRKCQCRPSGMSFPDWCHLCGGRFDADHLIEVLIPENAEHAPEPITDMLRVCRGCVAHMAGTFPRQDDQLVARLREWLRASGLRPARSYRHAIDLCDLARREIGAEIHSATMAQAASLEGFPVRRWRSRPALIGVSESSYQDL